MQWFHLLNVTGFLVACNATKNTAPSVLDTDGCETECHSADTSEDTDVADTSPSDTRGHDTGDMGDTSIPVQTAQCPPQVVAFIDGTAFQSVQVALDASVSGNVIEVCPGDHLGGFQISDPDDITIQGMDPRRRFSILKGDIDTPVFTLPAGARVVIERLTLTEGEGLGSAITAEQGIESLTLIDVAVTANRGEETFHIWGHSPFKAGTLHIQETTFSGNKPDRNGAVVGVRCVENLKIIDSIFKNNSQTPIEAAWDRDHGSPNPIELIRTSFIANSGSYTAIEVDDFGIALFGTGAQLLASGLVVQDNVARSGATIRMDSYNAQVDISNTDFSYNVARNSDAAITLANFGEVDISNSSFTANKADHGATVGASTPFGTSTSHHATITDSTFTANISSGDNGTVSVTAPWLFDITNVQFDGNTPTEVFPCPLLGNGVFSFLVDPAAGVYCE